MAATAPARSILLLATEIDGYDIRSVLDRLGGRRVVLRMLVIVERAVLALRLELELEIDCRIYEAGDRRERDCQPRRRLVEAQADLEAVVAHLQVPEAVLNDDRHLVRKA